MDSTHLKIVAAFYPIADVFSAALCNPFLVSHFNSAPLDSSSLHNAAEAPQALLKWLPRTSKMVLSQICKGIKRLQVVHDDCKLDTSDNGNCQCSADTSESTIYHAVIFFLSSALAPVMADVPVSALASVKLEAACLRLLGLIQDVSKASAWYVCSDRIALGEVWRNYRDTLPRTSPSNNDGAFLVSGLRWSLTSFQLLLRALFLALSSCWRRTLLPIRTTRTTGTKRRPHVRSSRLSTRHRKIGKDRDIYGKNCGAKIRTATPCDSVDSLLLFYPAEYFSRQLEAARSQKSSLLISIARKDANTTLSTTSHARNVKQRKTSQGTASKDCVTGEVLWGARGRSSRRRSSHLRGPRLLTQGYRRSRSFSEESSTTTHSSSTGDETISSSSVNEVET
ncbi:unnamed protein product [Phytomonas sp. EM1]|nr:unnamed protein product [Phytomonas sp. EM1]|eukprot:CCW60299.1 unnamed protein product [Phytomonas sp. isolate EM1]